METVEDCISREKALNVVHKYFEHYLQLNDDICLDGLRSLPSVTPKEKTGYWVEENINEWSRKVFCSKCDCPPPLEHISNGDVYSAIGYGVINKTKYCPNCGAKMVEPQESEMSE